MPSRRPPCAGLWNTPIVHVNGDLTTCCLDTKLLNRLGNLREHSLGELWNGPELHAWRVAQIKGAFEQSGPYCPDCNWRSAGFYPPDKVLEYLQKTGEAETLAFLSAQGVADAARTVPAREPVLDVSGQTPVWEV